MAYAPTRAESLQNTVLCTSRVRDDKIFTSKWSCTHLHSLLYKACLTTLIVSAKQVTIKGFSNNKFKKCIYRSLYFNEK